MTVNITFDRLAAEALRGVPWAAELAALLHDVGSAVMAVAAAVGRGSPGADALARASRIPERRDWLVAFEALSGPSEVELGAPVATLFSVLRRPAGPGDAAGDFLQAGARQVAAGYALHGPCTMLVVALGRGAQGFILDRHLGDFVLTHPDLRIPAGARPMRRAASPVAEVHRILLRGGVLQLPRDAREPGGAGCLGLAGEAAPLAFLVEQAGGAAVTTGGARLLDLVPTGPDQRVPVLLGERAEVERIARGRGELALGEEPFRSPLFGSRSLFSQP